MTHISAHNLLIATVTAAAAAGPLVITVPAAAAGAPAVAAVSQLAKGYFDWTLRPGQSRSDAVVVGNNSAQTTSYVIYPTDAGTAPLSDISYPARGVLPTQTGTWVHLDAPRAITLPGGAIEVSIQPRRSLRVNFTVSVPAAANQQDWVAGLMAQDAAPPPSSGGRGTYRIISITRTGLPIVVHVPGPSAYRFDFGATPFVTLTNNYQVVNIPIDDQGNRVIRPQLDAAVYRCGDAGPTLQPKPAAHAVASLTRQLDAVTAFAQITYPWELAGDAPHLAAGCYVIDLEMRYQGEVIGSGAFRFAVTRTQVPRAVVLPSTGGRTVPWLMVAGAGLAVLLVVAGSAAVAVRRLRRR
jgi:LPXTG-motif cell wall-anchored protein